MPASISIALHNQPFRGEATKIIPPLLVGNLEHRGFSITVPDHTHETTMRTFGILHREVCAGVGCLLLSMTTLWPSGAIGREMSLTCAYEIMTSAREAMVLCEGTLDRKTEHAYQEFRATLKRFINENAKLDNDKIAPDYDKVRSLRAREEVANGFCKLPEYLSLKVMLQELLQREATFRERLERSVDPTEGECL